MLIVRYARYASMIMPALVCSVTSLLLSTSQACGHATSSARKSMHDGGDALADAAADASVPGAPLETGDGWPVSSAAAEDIDTTVLAELEAAIDHGAYVTPDALLIARHGKLVYERYGNGWSIDRLHDLRSATKSVTSALTGIAIDRGQLAGVQSPVLPFFAAAGPFQHVDAHKTAITVEHLLTMSSGFECDDWNPESAGNEEKMYVTKDWVRFVLDLPMARAPGAQSAYCTGGVVVLGAILGHATGQDVPAFARAALFEPLGIEKAEWQPVPNGDTDTGGHLALRARDFAKVAQLYLNRGSFGAERVVSAEWVDASAVDRFPMEDSRYGYLWWLNTYALNGTQVPVSFARGNGGQYAFVVPSLDMVIVFLGSDYNGPGSAQPIELTGRYVLRAALAE